MATRMNVSLNYGTHLPLLISTVRKTTGSILELGMGVFSTPFLHYIAVLDNREVLSVENFKDWSEFFLDKYSHKNHKIRVIDSWDDLDKVENINREWDVVLVDQTPDLARIEAVKKLANKAKYIIIHDSTPKYESNYHYSEIYPLFKYRRDWTLDRNHATVLSNFVSLEDLWTL